MFNMEMSMFIKLTQNGNSKVVVINVNQIATICAQDGHTAIAVVGRKEPQPVSESVDDVLARIAEARRAWAS